MIRRRPSAKVTSLSIDAAVPFFAREVVYPDTAGNQMACFRGALDGTLPGALVVREEFLEIPLLYLVVDAFIIRIGRVHLGFFCIVACSSLESSMTMRLPPCGSLYVQSISLFVADALLFPLHRLVSRHCTRPENRAGLIPSEVLVVCQPTVAWG